MGLQSQRQVKSGHTGRAVAVQRAVYLRGKLVKERENREGYKCRNQILHVHTCVYVLHVHVCM